MSALRGLPSCMWQVWQVGAAARLGQDAVLLEQVAHPVLRGAEYISHCGMVEAHVAGLAGLRLARLLRPRTVAGVAGVARGEAEAGALRLSRSISSSVLRPILWQPPQPFMWAWH